MSFVGEIFSQEFFKREREFAKRKDVSWENVMQALASYKHLNPDVRLELSGLKHLGEKILHEFVEFMMNFKPEFEIIYTSNNGLKIFGLVGREEEIVKRIENENKRKKEITPFLIKNVKEFAEELVKKLYMLRPIVALRGSASPKSNNLSSTMKKMDKKFLFQMLMWR